MNNVWFDGEWFFDEVDSSMLVQINEHFTVVGTPPKPNRAQRRAEAKRVAANRRRLMKAIGHEHHVERSDNELATRHPLDCGRHCLLCHGEKFLESGSRRLRERRQAFALEEVA